MKDATDRQPVVNSYVSDMLALENHIAKALESQLKDLAGYPSVTAELQTILGTVRGHASALESLLQQRGGDSQSPIKKVGSRLLGFAAGAIDLVRSEGLPKNLRDDYTACSLATIGYVMLHTTGLSLDEREVGELAQRHLANYARIVMTLHNVVPSAVIQFLQEEGLPATDDVLSEISENIEGVWREQSGQVPDADEVRV
ncbi:MAG: DUF892 family protein [Gemmatimonadetes bacterium]|nr:DUF892 family protein [Gemmatimonadota bacterium]